MDSKSDFLTSAGKKLFQQHKCPKWIFIVNSKHKMWIKLKYSSYKMVSYGDSDVGDIIVT